MTSIYDLYPANKWVNDRSPDYVFTEEFADYVKYIHDLRLEKLAVIAEADKVNDVFQVSTDKEEDLLFASNLVSTQELKDMWNELQDLEKEIDAYDDEIDATLKEAERAHGKKYADDIDFFSVLSQEELRAYGKDVKILN